MLGGHCGRIVGGVVKPPSITERTIQLLEVSPSPNQATANIDRANVMSALTHAGGNALQGDFRRVQSKIPRLNAVALTLPFFDAFKLGHAAERAFEGKINLGAGQPVEVG